MKLQNVRVKGLVSRIAALSLTLVASLASCGDNIVDPKLPVGAVQFTPPSHYTTWWQTTESCSGRSGSLADVRWYEVPGVDFFILDGKAVSAYWSAGTNQIVVASDVRDNGQVVRHEMLHALLGEKGHSRDQFLEKCDGIVTCTAQCVVDAVPAPPVPSSVARISPSALEVTLDIRRDPPFGSVAISHYTVTMRTRNPAASTVFVNLPTLSQFGVSFALSLSGATSKLERVFVHDYSSATFAAGETKIHVFDLFVDNQGLLPWHIERGPYTVRASFGGHGAPVESLHFF